MPTGCGLTLNVASLKHHVAIPRGATRQATPLMPSTLVHDSNNPFNSSSASCCPVTRADFFDAVERERLAALNGEAVRSTRKNPDKNFRCRM